MHMNLIIKHCLRDNIVIVSIYVAALALDSLVQMHVTNCKQSQANIL